MGSRLGKESSERTQKTDVNGVVGAQSLEKNSRLLHPVRTTAAATCENDIPDSPSRRKHVAFTPCSANRWTTNPASLGLVSSQASDVNDKDNVKSAFTPLGLERNGHQRTEEISLSEASSDYVVILKPAPENILKKSIAAIAAHRKKSDVLGGVNGSGKDVDNKYGCHNHDAEAVGARNGGDILRNNDAKHKGQSGGPEINNYLTVSRINKIKRVVNETNFDAIEQWIQDVNNHGR